VENENRAEREREAKEGGTPSSAEESGARRGTMVAGVSWDVSQEQPRMTAACHPTQVVYLDEHVAEVVATQMQA
jgi:hypothetical protein